MGGFCDEKSRNLNAQRSINWYPVTTKEGKDTRIIAMYPTAGSNLFTANANIDSTFCVDGGTVYTTTSSSASNYTLVQTLGSTGTLAEIANFYTGKTYGPSMAQDYQRVVVTALPYLTSSNTGNIVWTVDKTNTAVNGLLRLEDSLKINDVAQLDGYFVVSTLGFAGAKAGRIYANFIDASNGIGNIAWTGVDFATMYYKGEDVTKLMTAGGYMYAFCPTHFEIWYNSGNELFPFEPIKEATQEIGLIHKYAICQLENMIAFIGTSANGGRGIYLLKGLELTKISTPGIDTILDQGTYFNPTINGNAYDQSFHGAFARTEEGHKFFYFKTQGVPRGYVYDLTTEMWHEWEQEFQNDGFRPRYDAGFSCWGKTYAVTDMGEIVELDPALSTDLTRNAGTGALSNTLIKRTRITQHLSGEDHYIFHKRLRLDIEANSTISHDANVTADVTLSLTDNDGKSWSTVGTKSFANASYGAISGDKRMEWFRLGRSDDRVYKIVANTNCPVWLSGAFVDIERGTR